MNLAQSNLREKLEYENFEDDHSSGNRLLRKWARDRAGFGKPRLRMHLSISVGAVTPVSA